MWITIYIEIVHETGYFIHVENLFSAMSGICSVRLYLRLPWIYNYMQKMNIILQTVFEILKFKKSCNLIGGKNFGLQLNNQIFPRHAFFTNHIANYGALFKAQKVILPSLKCHIFHFWSIPTFVPFTQLPRQQKQSSKIWLCHFLVYMAKHPHAKN